MNKNSRFLRPVSLVLLALSAFYIVRFLQENLPGIQRQDAVISIPVLMSGLFLSITGHLLSAGAWFLAIRKLHPQAGFAGNLRTWAVSRLARYIPGKLMAYLVRYGLLADVSRGNITRASIVEWLTTLTSIGGLGLLALCLYFSVLPVFVRVSLAVPFLVVVCVWSVSVYLAGSQRCPDSVRAFLVSGSDRLHVIRLSSIQFLVALIHGLAFFVVLSEFTGVSGDDFIYLVALYYLAGLIGQLSVFSPSGLGVREAALLVLLSPVVTNEAGLALGVLWIRVVLIASEILVASVAELIYRFNH